MGSYPMFTRFECPKCLDSSFIHNDYDPRCIDCENAVSPLAGFDSRDEFRRQYLRIMLLGPNSLGLERRGHPVVLKFRLLTFCSNGMPGNISVIEDILDRVLKFV